MKRYGNLYPQLWDFDNLLRAARQAQRGKRFTSGCRNFNLDLEKNLVCLQRELQDQSYRPGHYNHFRIYEPKERLISAAPYKDRVVHHALVKVIEPIFDRAMIDDSYANRLGKGTHKAVDRFTQFARRRRYVFKMDVVRFFPSLDHHLLTEAISKKVKDKEIAWLVGVILDSGLTAEAESSPDYFPGDNLFTPLSRNRGLPIGNLIETLERIGACSAEVLACLLPWSPQVDCGLMKTARRLGVAMAKTAAGHFSLTGKKSGQC